MGGRHDADAARRMPDERSGGACRGDHSGEWSGRDHRVWRGRTGARRARRQVANMLETDWSDSWRGAFRIELRAEAVGLAWHGWPVLPGTYPAGSQWAGREGTENAGPVPVHRDW